jgi:GGDEF domain-containing protein
VSLAANGAAPRKLVPVLRSRLRHSDRLCRLDAQRFVVVAHDTDLQTAEALAADLRRHLQRAELVMADVEIEVQEPDAKASAEDLLLRIETDTRHPLTPRPTG